jgi:Holliday junction resolvasome RuvABC endonuclease subunit
VHEYQPAHLKRLVTGMKDATKDNVQRVVEAAHPELKALWPKRLGDVEHAADAASAIHAVILTNTKGG